MKTMLMLLFGLILGLSGCEVAGEGCVSDGECRYGRVCEEGLCIGEPDPSVNNGSSNNSSSNNRSSNNEYNNSNNNYTSNNSNNFYNNSNNGYSNNYYNNSNNGYSNNYYNNSNNNYTNNNYTNNNYNNSNNNYTNNNYNCDCDDGLVCIDGYCEPCVSTSECGSSETCSNANRCVAGERCETVSFDTMDRCYAQWRCERGSILLAACQPQGAGRYHCSCSTDDGDYAFEWSGGSCDLDLLEDVVNMNCNVTIRSVPEL